MDPIVISAQIVNALQTIVSRGLDITKLPAVVTVGAINGGVRYNIIPPTVEMLGTIRTFSPEMRQQVIDRMGALVSGIASANGASATLELMPAPDPVLVNDPALSARVTSSLKAVVGDDGVRTLDVQTVSEDFSHVTRAVPSVFYFVGVTPPGQDAATAPDNHSELFYVDEAGIAVGCAPCCAWPWTISSRSSSNPESRDSCRAARAAQQVDGKAAEPVPALVVLARDRGQRGIRMDHCLGFERCTARIAGRQTRFDAAQHPGAAQVEAVDVGELRVLAVRHDAGLEPVR